MTAIALILQSELQGSVADLLAQTGPVAKFVLLLLLGFSILSWAIIYIKWRRFKKLHEQGDVFLRAFRKARKLSEFNVLLENLPPHPLKALFEAGYREICAQVGNPGGPVRNAAALTRALQIASTQQLSEMEQNLNWLATTGSVAPFIGLFGGDRVDIG